MSTARKDGATNRAGESEPASEYAVVVCVRVRAEVRLSVVLLRVV